MTLSFPSNKGMTVRPVLEENDRTEAQEYIDVKMMESFGFAPPRSRGIIFVAEQDGEIVNSVTFDVSTADELFPLEMNYTFNHDYTPFPFNRAEIVQAGRWVATKPGVSWAVGIAVMPFFHALGKRYFLAEAKPYALKQSEKFDIDCCIVEGAQLNLESIESMVQSGGIQYYTQEPLPQLFMMSIEQVMDALS